MKKNTFLNLFAFLIVTSFFAQETYFVKSTGDNSDGLSEATAFTSVELANNNAAVVDGDIIKIVGSISLLGPAQTIITKSLKFEGKDNGIIIGDNSGNRLFGIGKADVVISFSDITFKDNTANGAGGVFSVTITNTGGFTDVNLTINNCNFESNESAANGGAIFVNGGKINVSGSTFYNNKGANGGAMFLINANTVGNITNCSFFQNTIVNNNGAFGAAIRAETSAIVTVTNSLGWDNTSGNGSLSGFNANPGAVTTAINSLFSFANNIDTATDSNLSVDLTNSSVSWNATLNKVTFTAPDVITDDTPIDFGTDTSDVGAWDSKINIFKGGTTGAVEAWTTAANWSAEALPTATDNVAILSGAACTLDGEATINDIKVTARLDIKNNRVLIVNGEANVTGTVNYLRNLTDSANLLEAWHLISSPLSGEVFDATFVADNDIAVNNSNKGIATYNAGQTGDAAWTYLTAGSINAANGQGYSMKITPDGDSSGNQRADNVVVFQGDFNTDNAGVTTSSLSTGFNLVGNPYTSFLNSATFLGANANIDQTQIWIWNSASGAYEVKIAGDPFILAPAQGFFVFVTSGGTLNFAESNQATTGDSFQKTSIAELNLLITDGQKNRFTKIYYSDNATKGFDLGWEGEVFGGISNSLDVFTHLVEDNQGKKYQVQSLPFSEIESLVVPIGIKAEASKELIFSAKANNLPDNVNIYLEDRQENKFTLLNDVTSYKITINNALSDVGRFYIHTTPSSTLSAEDLDLESVTIYLSDQQTLKMVGLPQGKSTVRLYNILGKQIINSSFTSTGEKELSLSKMTKGVYIIHLETIKGKLNKKIVLK
jgi:hypothetical protein